MRLVILVIAILLVSGCSHQPSVPTPVAPKAVPSVKPSTPSITDINSAPKSELEALPGIGEAYAQKIIDHRPYREKTDLVRLKIIPESTYKAIADKIIAHHQQ